jgi:hypothetical protein
MDESFNGDAYTYVKAAVRAHGKPEIINSD